MAPSLTADPAAIEALASLVGARVGEVRTATARFRGPALDVGDAFGFLGRSPDILRDYLDLAQGCVGALGDLQHTLDSIARALRATAAAYRETEAANTPGG